MKTLENIQVTPFTGFRCPDEEDIVNDQIALKVAIHYARLLFDPDFTRITVSGVLHSIGGTDIAICDGTSIISTATVEGAPPCTLYLQCPDDKTKDYIRRDTAQLIQDAWLSAKGLPDDYPCDSKTIIREDGALAIEVTPCL